jgi:DnaK suppressor protein
VARKAVSKPTPKAVAKKAAKAVAKTPAKSAAKTPAKSAAKTPAKSAAKTPAKSAAKTPAKLAPAATATGSRPKDVTTPTTAAKPTVRSTPPATTAAPSKAASAPSKASDSLETDVAKAASPERKAPAVAARPGGGLGAKPAPAKRVSEGYVKDERFLAGQRTALTRERATYIEQAASLKAEAEALVEEMEPGDIQFDDESGEGGTVTVDRERDLALSAQALAAVEEIDHALAKMDNGTYGICENCGRLVVKARLEALPYARLCIDCKSGGLSKR